MLTCLAEGRAADDDEENHYSKGSALVCELSVADVQKAVWLSDKWIASKEEPYLSKLVMDTAKQAVNLTKLAAEV